MGLKVLEQLTHRIFAVRFLRDLVVLPDSPTVLVERKWISLKAHFGLELIFVLTSHATFVIVLCQIKSHLNFAYFFLKLSNKLPSVVGVEQVVWRYRRAGTEPKLFSNMQLWHQTISQDEVINLMPDRRAAGTTVPFGVTLVPVV